MKALIFDAGPIINFSINGLLDVIEHLKKDFNGKFLITEAVKYEIIDHPLTIPKFELSALRVQNLIDKGILEFPDSLNIDNEIIKRKSKEFMDIANHFVFTKDTWVNILSEGEASCLALSTELEKINIENIIAIDERTTRILAEKPDNLQKIFSEKLHTNVKVNLENVKEFTKFKFVRSTELVYVAYKKNLFDIKGKKVLEAALYATKFKGSSVSYDEINELKKL